MKILLAIDDYSSTSEGGSVTIVRRLATKLSKTHQVAILTSHRRGKDFKRTKNGITIYSLNINYPVRFRAYLSLYNPAVTPRLQTILKEFKPDVVHAHTIHMYLTYDLLRLAREITPKVYFTAHDAMTIFYGRLRQFLDTNKDGTPDAIDPQFNFLREWQRNKLHFNPLRNPIIRWYLSKTKVIAVSDLIKEVLEKNGIKVSSVIHNGIDVKKWKVKSSEIRRFKRKYKIDNKKALLIAGRIRQDKGSLITTSLLADLEENVVLIIAGKRDRGVRQAIELAEKLGVKDQLVITGFLKQKQLKAAYHAADIVLAPSLCLDTFSSVSLEALASKRPLIISPFCGLSNLLISGKHAEIVNPFNNYKNLLKTTKKLLAEKKYSKALAENGNQLVKNKVSLEIFSAKHLSLYQV